MKISTIALSTSNPIGSLKGAVLMNMMAIGKTYELLHKQLYRKNDPYGNKRLKLFDAEFTYEGKTCKAIHYYDIKSSSVDPYDRDDVNDLGLNQFFMGQNPYKPYIGDPKDGIYHDRSQIIPKQYDLDSTDIYGWVLGDRIFPRINPWGEPVCNGVIFTGSLPVAPNDEMVCEYTVIYADGTQEIVDASWVDESGEQIVTRCDRVRYVNLTKEGLYAGRVVMPFTGSYGGRKELENDNGEIKEWYDVTVDLFWVGSKITDVQNSDGEVALSKYTADFDDIPSRLFVYENGTAIIISPSHRYDQGGESNFVVTRKAKMRYCPLVDMATGDLVMSRTKFVEEWNELFELFVGEDMELWQQIIPIVSLVLSVIIPVLSPIFATLTAGMQFAMVFGSILGWAGGMSGSRELQILGALMQFGAGAVHSTAANQAANSVDDAFLMSSTEAYNSAYQGAYQGAMESMTVGMVVDHTFDVMTSSLGGAANMLSLGYSVYGLTQVQDVGKATEESVDDSMKITLDNEEDEAYQMYHHSEVLESV